MESTSVVTVLSFSYLSAYSSQINQECRQSDDYEA